MVRQTVSIGVLHVVIRTNIGTRVNTMNLTVQIVHQMPYVTEEELPLAATDTN
jgi:hypothetical protein